MEDSGLGSSSACPRVTAVVGEAGGWLVGGGECAELGSADPTVTALGGGQGQSCARHPGRAE